jgi:hypothetical protein
VVLCSNHDAQSIPSTLIQHGLGAKSTSSIATFVNPGATDLVRIFEKFTSPPSATVVTPKPSVGRSNSEIEVDRLIRRGWLIYLAVLFGQTCDHLIAVVDRVIEKQVLTFSIPSLGIIGLIILLGILRKPALRWILGIHFSLSGLLNIVMAVYLTYNTIVDPHPEAPEPPRAWLLLLAFWAETVFKVWAAIALLRFPSVKLFLLPDEQRDELYKRISAQQLVPVQQ